MARILIRVVLAVMVFIICFPVLFILMGSLLGPDDLSNYFSGILEGSGTGYIRWQLVPSELSIESFRQLLFFQPGFFRLFWNTVFIVVCVLTGQLLVGAPAAWGLAQYEFPGRKALFTLYIIFMMFPFQVLMLPEYIHLAKLGLMDTLGAVILPGIFSSFPVFIEYNFFRGISSSVLDAARLDGAGEWQIFWEIGLPAGMPGVAASMMLQFLEYWSTIEQPLAFLDTKSKWPLSLYLPQISMDNVGISFAASLISMIPAILIFRIGQPCLEGGIAAMGVKR